MSIDVTCSIDGCNKRMRARTWCRMHYNRWMRHGDPAVTVHCTKEKRLAFVAEMVAAPASNECVIWPFAKDAAGYGVHVLGPGAAMRATHLVAWIAFGPPPTTGHVIAHAPVVCHNPACVNPAHLRWATPAENAADRVLDGTNTWGEHTPEGMAARSTARAKKLTPDQVRAIKADTRLLREIAADYPIGEAMVGHIKSGRSWAHVV